MTSASVLTSLGLALSLAGCSTVAADKGTVLVVGGGQSGQPTARILAEQGYDVRVMVRDPSRSRGLPATASVVAGDATRPESLAAGFAGVDYAIITIGFACEANKPAAPGAGPEDVDYRGVANLADAAKTAGTKQVVLMSALRAGSAGADDPLNKMCGNVLDWKGKGEDHLRSSGVPYTVVRPGGLKPFPGQPACTEGKEPLALYPGAEGGSGALCRSDVALVMIDALGNADALGKTVNLIADQDKSAPVDAWRARWAQIPRD